LSEEISSNIGNKIHFEWIVKRDRNSNQIKVSAGLHLEYPRDEETNQEILEFLRGRVNFNELKEEENEELEIPEDFRIWRWVYLYKLYSELDDDAVDWAVNSMIRLYEKLLPPLKEFLKT